LTFRGNQRPSNSPSEGCHHALASSVQADRNWEPCREGQLFHTRSGAPLVAARRKGVSVWETTGRSTSLRKHCGMQPCRKGEWRCDSIVKTCRRTTSAAELDRPRHRNGPHRMNEHRSGCPLAIDPPAITATGNAVACRLVDAQPAAAHLATRAVRRWAADGRAHAPLRAARNAAPRGPGSETASPTSAPSSGAGPPWRRRQQQRCRAGRARS
jgi:hypothetical protein